MNIFCLDKTGTIHFWHDVAVKEEVRQKNVTVLTIDEVAIMLASGQAHKCVGICFVLESDAVTTLAKAGYEIEAIP